MEFKFIKKTHSYLLDGQELNHITQITSQFLPVPFFNEQARLRGSAIHEAIELNDPSSLPAEWYDYFSAWNKFISDTKFITFLSEKPLYHPDGRWAGTYDRFGNLNGFETIIEIKAGPDHPAYHLQTAAQQELIKVNYHYKVKRRYLLQLKDDGKYILHKHTGIHDYSLFLAALNIYRWKKRNNIS